jgi:DsbC/DsbD-like thiol-disulfide interchange protein
VGRSEAGWLTGGLALVARRAAALSLIVAGVLSPIAEAQVSASLVASDLSVQPNHPLTVVVRLEHQPTWHTFWVNAGAGVATTISWELPAGWTAGAIQWPVPVLIKTASNQVLGAGYSDVVDFAVTLGAPRQVKVGETVNVKAHVTWDMCAQACQPGVADLSLALPVSNEAPEPNSAVRAELARRVLPETLPGDWQFSASQTDKEVTLTLVGHGGFRGPHFFSEDAYIQYDLPQKIAPVAGKLAFTLPITEKAHPAVPRLRGILAYTDANGTYHGVRVDVPLPPASRSAP